MTEQRDTVFVNAYNEGWKSTGIIVQAGHNIQLTATGSWRVVSSSPWYGQDGFTEIATADYLCPNAHKIALVVKIGTVSCFEASASYTGAAAVTGELLSGCNDQLDHFSDNEGSMEVVVTILAPTPTPTDTPTLSCSGTIMMGMPIQTDG